MALVDNVLIIGKNFYYSNTYLALAIIAGLLLFFWLKPKAALKMIGALLLFLLIIYGFSSLGKSSSIGMDSKKQMINQTLEQLD